MTRTLAPHVRAAIGSGLQPMKEAPKRPLALHLQKALGLAMQAKPRLQADRTPPSPARLPLQAPGKTLPRERVIQRAAMPLFNLGGLNLGGDGEENPFAPRGILVGLNLNQPNWEDLFPDDKVRRFSREVMRTFTGTEPRVCGLYASRFALRLRDGGFRWTTVMAQVTRKNQYNNSDGAEIRDLGQPIGSDTHFYTIAHIPGVGSLAFDNVHPDGMDPIDRKARLKFYMGDQELVGGNGYRFVELQNRTIAEVVNPTEFVLLGKPKAPAKSAAKSKAK